MWTPPVSPLSLSPSHSGDMGAGAMRPRHAVVPHSEAPAWWLGTHARSLTRPPLAHLPSPCSPAFSLSLSLTRARQPSVPTPRRARCRRVPSSPPRSKPPGRFAASLFPVVPKESTSEGLSRRRRTFSSSPPAEARRSLPWRLPWPPATRARASAATRTASSPSIFPSRA